jgi:hypothetical protein
MQLGVNRRAEPDRIGSCPQQDGSGVSGDLPVRGETSTLGAPRYSHFAGASSVEELVSLAAPFSLLRSLFFRSPRPNSQLTGGSE